ncbi:hypothetical protein KM043_016836 [Ampulex compressa]|nr:hypothetical protein KM043_016836 [Ampulex compressa]
MIQSNLLVFVAGQSPRLTCAGGALKGGTGKGGKKKRKEGAEAVEVEWSRVWPRKNLTQGRMLEEWGEQGTATSVERDLHTYPAYSFREPLVSPNLPRLRDPVGFYRAQTSPVVSEEKLPGNGSSAAGVVQNAKES